METVSFNSQTQQIFQILSKAPQEPFDKGDILRGRIVSFENNVALLKLSDGSALTVKVPDGLEIDINTIITLEISDRIEGQLIAKILSIANLSESDKTEMSVLESVLKNGLLNKIDSQILNQIIQNIISWNEEPSAKLISDAIEILEFEPGLTVEQGTFAAVNNIKPDSETTSEMLKILQKISEHEFQLSDSLEIVKSELLQEIFKADTSLKQEIIRLLVIENHAKAMVSEIENEFPSLSENISDSAVYEKLIELFLDQVADSINGSTVINNETAANIAEDFLSMVNKDTGTHEKTKALNMTGNTMELKIAPDSEMAVKLLVIIHKTVENIHTHEKRVLQDIENEVKLLLDEIVDRIMIDEEELSESISLKQKARSFADIIKLTKYIMDRLNINNESALFQTFNEIDQAFRFFWQVTSYNYCLQLPLRFKNEPVTGELYIMKRRGRNKIDLNDFTLFFSLKTKALGMIEAFINSKNRRISINFRLEQEELTKLFKDNYMILYNGLMEKGYMLVDFKCRLLEKERTNILNAQEKAESYLNLKSRVDLKI
ncbi:MAG: hypothetical protein GX187_01365 [Clostridiaceae bacterium]|nr:hypothetical protein [Clostridiaceae bacterium]